MARLETHTRTADGLQIRYAEFNSEAEPTVLLLCPWPESLYAWEQVLPALSANAHVIALDLPGFGHSEGRAELYAPRAMAQFLAMLIAEWDLGKPHVVGPDVGCPATLFLAADSPASLASAVVGNGATEWPLVVGGALKALIDNPDPDSLLAVEGSDVVRQSMGLHETYEVTSEALSDYLSAYAGRRFGESAQFVRNYPTDLPVLAELLPQIEIPVLVLASDHDPMVPASNAESLTAKLPQSRYVSLDAGHFAWEDQAEAYRDALISWVHGERS